MKLFDLYAKAYNEKTVLYLLQYGFFMLIISAVRFSRSMLFYLC
jgi:hypothetical protein